MTNCPEINSEWLLTGDGEMLKKNMFQPIEGTNSENTYIPLIPPEGMENFNNDDFHQTKEILETYKIPELEYKGVQYLIKVFGSSMHPKYSNADVLACRPVEDLSFFQWGKVYVLYTNQGTIVKRLFPCENDAASIECHSDNKDYPPFIIKKTSIKAVAIVVGVIRLE